MPDYSVQGLPESFGYMLSEVAIFLIIFRIIASIKKDNKSRSYKCQNGFYKKIIIYH